MKNKAIMILLLALTICIPFASCTKDNGNGGNGSNDNTGIEFRMRNYENGNDRIILLQIDDALHDDSNGLTANSNIKLGISRSNNFYAEGRFEGNTSNGVWVANTETPFWSIASVGNVTGLGRINTIPETGWASEVAVHPGNGYVIRCKWDGEIYSGTGLYAHFCRYARVYVEDWIESTSGGIIGAVIRYEDNWKIEE